MKTFHYTIRGKQLTIRLHEKQGTIANLLVDGHHPLPPEEEMPAYAAAIPLAPLPYDAEVVHDDASGIITVEHHRTGWNNPSALMMQLQ